MLCGQRLVVIVNFVYNHMMPRLKMRLGFPEFPINWQAEIDDSTPVSQSRHTLRFQPIAYRSIMRCPRVLTRPEMVWQAFVPDTASGQLAVFDMAEKTPVKQNCCYGQCKSDQRYPDK